MPRRMNPEVRERIISAAVNQPSTGAVRMHQGLKQLIDSGKVPGPLPSVRAIGDVLSEARKKMPAAEQELYRELYWPESFTEGRLPWEAAEAAFDLLRYSLLGELPRPYERETLWYWRLSVSVPESTFSSDSEVRRHWWLRRAASRLRAAEARSLAPETTREIEFSDVVRQIERDVVRQVWETPPYAPTSAQAELDAFTAAWLDDEEHEAGAEA